MDHHIQEDSRRRCSKELNEETVRFKVGTSNLPKLTANRWSETSKSAETMQRFLVLNKNRSNGQPSAFPCLR